MALDSTALRVQCLSSQQYAEAGTFLVMEIKLDKALVRKRSQEELARRCVQPGYKSGANSSFLQGRNRAVQRASPLQHSVRTTEGLSQSPLLSGEDLVRPLKRWHLICWENTCVPPSWHLPAILLKKRHQSSTTVSVLPSGLCFPLIPACLPLAHDVELPGQDWPPTQTALGSTAVTNASVVLCHFVLFRSLPTIFSPFLSSYISCHVIPL